VKGNSIAVHDLKFC